MTTRAERKEGWGTGDAARRRALLTYVGAAGVAATAGCLSGERPAEREPAGDPAAPARYAQDATVSIVTPRDGETVHGFVSVVMAAENVAIESAGKARDGAGHFHLIIDGEPTPRGEIIPADATHKHFGEASKETVLDLEPGEHRLVLQLGDGNHRASRLTDEVTITVVDDASISFVDLEDGASVPTPVALRWETKGVTLEPAGTVRQNAGYAHVLVDTDPIPVGKRIPSTPRIHHFGDGGTDATLDLTPGEHRLVVQLSNGSRLATPLTDEVRVTVTEPVSEGDGV
ncbi:DUF4399 domain-containing protein [Haloarchaeobius sp. TZWWS8]|uniref:DUF4399 domain-containing protein n=1 Tax=Haloarchaeobius sp. TZWWS8 TaxID=3446121 RepID=UPI003EC05768